MTLGTKTCVRIVAAVIVGAVLGASAAHLYHRRFLEAPPVWVYENCLLRITEDVNRLVAVYRGNTNYLITNAEADLNEQIHDLVRWFPSEALSKKDAVRTLRVVAKYRAQHPYETGNLEEDQAVQELLAKVRAKDLEPVGPTNVATVNESSTERPKK